MGIKEGLLEPNSVNIHFVNIENSVNIHLLTKLTKYKTMLTRMLTA